MPLSSDFGELFFFINAFECCQNIYANNNGELERAKTTHPLLAKAITRVRHGQKLVHIRHYTRPRPGKHWEWYAYILIFKIYLINTFCHVTFRAASLFAYLLLIWLSHRARVQENHV